MAQKLWENVTLRSTGSGGNTTTYSSKQYNGDLMGIYISTGGVGFTTTLGDTTASSGLSSTGVYRISSEKTGQQILAVAPPGVGGAWYYPTYTACSSSGGLLSSTNTSTGGTLLFSFNYHFPLANERLVLQSSSGNGNSTNYCATFTILTESAGYQ